MKTLRVSVAQITCIDGAVEHNLSHAYELVTEAGKNGAELVLFPEFMPKGYRLTNEIWNAAESFDGHTTNKIFGSPKDLTFSGKSVIIDADGTGLAELDDNEATGYGLVHLNPDLKKTGTIPKDSRYIYPGPSGREIIRLMEFQGCLNYTVNRLRIRKARTLSKLNIERVLK